MVDGLVKARPTRSTWLAAFLILGLVLCVKGIGEWPSLLTHDFGFSTTVETIVRILLVIATLTVFLKSWHSIRRGYASLESRALFLFGVYAGMDLVVAWPSSSLAKWLGFSSTMNHFIQILLGLLVVSILVSLWHPLANTERQYRITP